MEFTWKFIYKYRHAIHHWTRLSPNFRNPAKKLKKKLKGACRARNVVFIVCHFGVRGQSVCSILDFIPLNFTPINILGEAEGAKFMFASKIEETVIFM